MFTTNQILTLALHGLAYLIRATNKSLTINHTQKHTMKTQDTHKPSHTEIMQHIEEKGYGGDAIQPDGNPTPETYEDGRQELIDLNN
jgi:hypothetical protein